jgi:hypothetical protein
VAAAPSDDSEAAAEVKRKQDIVAKAMRRIAAPDKFKGDSAKDMDRVETWCQQLNNYLEALFYGVPRDEAKVPRMSIVLSLLDEPASTWVNNMYSEEAGHSWEDIMPQFIMTIRDGRDTPASLMERMDQLAYGERPCVNLLAFNKEFETLRVRLYPTSSIDSAMSQVVGMLYGKAIKRGDLALYVEVRRTLSLACGLNAEYQYSLSQWKAATAEAVKIVEMQRQLQQAAAGAGGGRGGGGWRRGDRAAVNQLQHAARAGQRDDEGDDHTRERQEGEQQGAGAAGPVEVQANVVGARRQGEGAGDRRQQQPHQEQSRRRFYLKPDELEKLKAAGRCFKCYQPGHRSADAVCKLHGQDNQRHPTAEELKA